MAAEYNYTIGWAIQFIEDGNVAAFREMVPSRVSPDDLSNGLCGTPRSVRAIAKHWAEQTGDHAIVNYIQQLDLVTTPTTTPPPNDRRLAPA